MSSIKIESQELFSDLSDAELANIGGGSQVVNFDLDGGSQVVNFDLDYLWFPITHNTNTTKVDNKGGVTPPLPTRDFFDSTVVLPVK